MRGLNPLFAKVRSYPSLFAHRQIPLESIISPHTIREMEFSLGFGGQKKLKSDFRSRFSCSAKRLVPKMKSTSELKMSLILSGMII